MGPAGSSLWLPSLPPGVPPDHPGELSAFLLHPHHPAPGELYLLWPLQPLVPAAGSSQAGATDGASWLPLSGWPGYPGGKGEAKALWVLVQSLWPRAAQRWPRWNFYKGSLFWEDR